jgi:hypothetical protein
MKEQPVHDDRQQYDPKYDPDINSENQKFGVTK